jgi:transposase
MKIGRTHLGHKAEHAVGFDTGGLIAVTAHGAGEGGTTTLIETAIAAAEQVEASGAAAEDLPPLGEIRGEKGGRERPQQQSERGSRSRGISAPMGRKRQGSPRLVERAEAAGARPSQSTSDAAPTQPQLDAVTLQTDRAPVRASLRGPGVRRTPQRGHQHMLRRLLIRPGGFRLGLLVRAIVGVGAPRRVPGRAALVLAALLVLVRAVRRRSHSGVHSRRFHWTASHYARVLSTRPPRPLVPRAAKKGRT